MNVMTTTQIRQVLRYLRRWLQAFQDNVELAAFVAEDVLAGNETEFSDLDKTFMEALDHVIYHAAHSTQAALVLLAKHRTHLSLRQLNSLKSRLKAFRATSTRMGAVIEALTDIYVFRKPPH